MMFMKIFEEMPQDAYYTAPSDEVFNEIKHGAIWLWNTYKDGSGYATEKIARIADIENVRDNAWYMIAMFDPINQTKLYNLLPEKIILQIEQHGK